MNTLTNQESTILQQLSRALGRNQWNGLEREIEQNGHALIRFDEPENGTCRNLEHQLEALSWRVKLSDKGLILTPRAA